MIRQLTKKVGPTAVGKVIFEICNQTHDGAGRDGGFCFAEMAIIAERTQQE